MPRQSGSRKRRTRGRRQAERLRARKLSAKENTKQGDRTSYPSHPLDRWGWR